MPQPAKDLTKNPLYAELLAIGTKDKTMNVAVLEKYDNLLESPEVLRRAKSETTRTARARSAQDALQAAIASIVAQGIREVAEAALCSTEAFEGLQINARVLKLPGVTIRTFTRRRTEAFEDIVRFLNRDASATPTASATSRGGRPVPSPDDEDINLRQFADIASRVARLHYASLGMIFAFRFEDALRVHDIPFDRDAIPLADYLFTAFVRLVYGYYPLSPGSFTRYNETHLPVHVAEADGTLMYSLWRDIAYYGPIGLETEGWRTLAAVASGWDRSGAREIYRDRWDEPRGMSSSKFPDLAIHLAGKSGALLLVWGRNVSFNIPIHAQARLMTHKALSNLYEFDEWTPIMDGHSLRHRAEAFFDSESVRLTSQVLK